MVLRSPSLDLPERLLSRLRLRDLWPRDLRQDRDRLWERLRDLVTLRERERDDDELEEDLERLLEGRDLERLEGCDDRLSPTLLCSSTLLLLAIAAWD